MQRPAAAKDRSAAARIAVTIAGSAGFPRQGTHINPFIWCAVGAVVGLLAGTVMGSNSKVARIEDMLVGIFGAFIGGEFLPSVLAAEGAAPAGFSGLALLAGVAGAGVMLALLAMMRKAVGPMRGRKSRAGTHR